MLELPPNCELCDKPGTRRRHTAYTREEIEAFAETLRAIPPAER